MADVQFGLCANLSGADEAKIERARKMRMIVRPAPKTTGFAQETELYTRAIDATNRLLPDFVINCGDMTNDAPDEAQLAELRRITAQLSNDLTPASLATYRERYGDDSYAFDHRGSRFIVINSNVAFYPPTIPGEWERLLDFLESALQGARDAGSTHTLMFTHHPLFLESADEEDSLLAIPRERRSVLLDLLHAYDADAVFSGHWHVNNYARDGKLQVVASAAVGYPLGNDPSGFRVVKVFQDRIEHEYFGFDEMPQSVDMSS